jgi:hypothetical protein
MSTRRRERMGPNTIHRDALSHLLTQVVPADFMQMVMNG